MQRPGDHPPQYGWNPPPPQGWYPPPQGWSPPPPQGWYPPPQGWYPPPQGWYPPPPAWYPPPSAVVPSPPRSGVGAVVAAVFVGLWLVAVAVLSSGAGWFAEQLVLVAGGTVPVWVWPAVALVAGLLTAVPALLLAMVPRAAAVRAAGRVWLLAAVAMAALGVLRAIPAVHHEVYLAAFAMLAAAGAAVLRIRRGRAPLTATARFLSLAAGIAVALPWVWVGALGGLLETVLAVAAAAALGWLATNVLDGSFWAPFGPGGARLVLLGGLVAGVALTLLAAGTGHSGTQLGELLVLPPLGFALAALHRLGPPMARGEAHLTAVGRGTGTAAGLLLGVAAFGPLAFVDPEEVSLLLTGRDVPVWAALAALVSLGVAALVGLGYGLTLDRVVPHAWLSATVAAVLLVVGAGVYVGPGQPGLHGDRLFVILKEQADLSGIAATGTGFDARNARAAEVYRRLVTTAERSQAGLRRELDRWRLPYTPYYLVNAVEVAGGPGVRAWLSARADVDRVLVSQRLRPLPAPAGVTRGDIRQPPREVPWNLRMINADRVVRELGVDGGQIHVGTSDSGVDGRHPELRGNFRGGDDSWYDPWNHTRTPTDSGGHGTHTLGSAVGSGVGVAPDARWVGCVNLDRNLGSPARYLDCLQFMLAPFPPGGDPFRAGRPERAPHVLTNSWGCPTIEGCDVGSLRTAVAAFAAAGVFFVAAAGNTGPFCDSVDDPPAVYPETLTVGAVDEERQVTEFSSRGPAAGGAAKPDIVAPGAGVLSAMPGGTYAEQDGTSMATPHVAGVVALMWSANPRLVGDLDRTRGLLRDTTIKLADDGTREGCGGARNVSGAGLVDAYAAVRAAQALG